MPETRLEVALLRWAGDGDAVQLVGRCRDAEMVELVRARLLRHLGDEPIEPGRPAIRLVPRSAADALDRPEVER